jgi:small ligand-binding sensory domain FIST
MSVRIGVGLAEGADTDDAVARACAEAAAGAGERPDLCLVFLGPPHAARARVALDRIGADLAPRRLLGCGGAGVVANRRELEGGSGVVVWAASLPGARLDLAHVEAPPGTGPDEIAGLPETEGAAAALALIDPYGFAADALVERLNQQAPGLPVLGGLASAAVDGVAPLLIDDELREGGAVVATLAGVDVLPCVSQGGSPIGPESAVTDAEGNLIRELAFQPAIERIAEIANGLSEGEREQIAEGGMLIGVTIDENLPEHGRGDYLVRPIVGVDREAGGLVIGERVRIGQTIRLHVRDAASAEVDLHEALAARGNALGEGGVAGALLFTCNGRGSGLYGEPGRDAAAVAEQLGAPHGGFFCAGEIGPVGGRNFLHGFTATLAIFGAGVKEQ